MKNFEKLLPAVWIETYGCQMNKCDSEMIIGMLSGEGFKIADNVDKADIVLVNTCSVREHAEKRALGRIHTLASWKRESANRKLGIIGCMAQRLGEQLYDSANDLDWIIGPDSYRTLPLLLKGLMTSTVHTDFKKFEHYDDITAGRESSISAWVTIMRGCDNFCSYCIVPYTRGRERSRPASAIIDEILSLVKNGIREICLLGQNVNSYSDNGLKFSGLLQKISDIPVIPRIRFMTSHPKDFSFELIDLIKDRDNICNHIHLPLQAGSDNILKSMNRQYTQNEYLSIIKDIRKRIPDAGISTDVMAGFPGETESDFQETLHILETVRFDEAFTYYFSPRSGTKAADMKNQVPKSEKIERLERVIKLQRKISQEIRESYIGKTVSVMIESRSKKSDNEWFSRTETNHPVIFNNKGEKIGDILPIYIEACKGSVLRGYSLKSGSI